MNASTWLVEDGWARRPGTPKPAVAPYGLPGGPLRLARPSSPHWRSDPLAVAKYEIRRRIDERRQPTGKRKARRFRRG